MARWVHYLIGALAVCPALATAEPVSSRAATSSTPVLQIRLVGSASTPELRELLLEWFAAEDARVSITSQASIASGQLTRASDGPPLRAWLVLRGRHRARIVLADAERHRYFVRDVPLDNALDELGREKLAQVLLASFQAFAEGRLEDMPVEQAEEALAEPVETVPDSADGSATVEARKPRAPSEGLPRNLVPETDSSAPGLEPSTTASGEGKSDRGRAPLSWAASASHSLIYRGPAGLAQGPGVELEGWFQTNGHGLGWFGGGRYELSHSEPAEPVVLRVHSMALRFGLLLATFHDARPDWHLGLGLGWDWISFEATQPEPGVEVRSGQRAGRPVVSAAFGRFVSFGPLRLGASLGAELALEKLHYDVLVEGRPSRALTPWQLAPLLLFSLGWH